MPCKLSDKAKERMILREEKQMTRQIVSKLLFAWNLSAMYSMRFSFMVNANCMTEEICFLVHFIADVYCNCKRLMVVDLVYYSLAELDKKGG